VLLCPKLLLHAQRPAAAGQGLSSASSAVEEVQYFDVIEYAPPQQQQAGSTRLGVVQDVSCCLNSRSRQAMLVGFCILVTFMCSLPADKCIAKFCQNQ
jgi:hypothetical protein